MKTQSFWPLGGCPPALSRSIVATAPISPRPRPLPPQMRVTVLELRVPGAAPDTRCVPPASFAHAYVCAGPPRRHARARYSPSACGRPGCRSLSVPPAEGPLAVPRHCLVGSEPQRRSQPMPSLAARVRGRGGLRGGAGSAPRRRGQTAFQSVRVLTGARSCSSS